MPSKTPKQAKFMRAIAHGWTPSRMKSPPSRAVAQEFVNADRKYSGGFAENRYWTGGLAAMDEVTAGGKRGSLDLFKWRHGGGVNYEENGMQRGGRARRRIGRVLSLDGQSGVGDYATPDPVYTPTQTIAGASGTDVIGPSGAEVTVAPTTTYSGPRIAGPRRGGRGGRGGYGGRRGGGGGGGGGGGTYTPPPPVETDPASYIAASAAPPDRESPYRDQLRAHQASIAATLGSARGGHVNYYEEGGDVRPAHAEGPNPHNPKTSPYQHKLWESEHHIDPPEPEEVVEDEVPEPGFLERWFGVAPEPENVAKTKDYLESIGEAHGGRVGYQAGGRVMPPPVGGVPPWIEPVGSGPGFMEPEPEPEGYQFGGMAARMGPAMRMARGIRGGGGQYRGVPPQRGGIQRGAPPGGGGGFLSRFRQQANQQRGAAPGFRGLVGGGQPQGGGLAAMMRQAMQQRGQLPGGGMPRGGVMGGQYDPGGSRPLPPGGIPNDFPGLDPYSEGELSRRGPRGPLAPGGGAGPLQLPIMDRPNPNIGRPGYDPIGDMGPIINYNRPGPVPTRLGGAGKPRPGPGMFPQGDERGPVGGGIIGGPRVPPNMTGYMQKRRMMNRPPANVGGAQAQRIGMQDQQGALARAMQRGTGRAPMSRRFGRGRAGPTQ